MNPFEPLAKFTQDAVLDANGHRSMAYNQRRFELAVRLCQVNNANVTRDLGSSVVDESTPVVALTPLEQADIDLMIKPEYAKP
jgi:hypothetical protein